MTKLTTAEVAGNIMLMTLINSPNAMKSKALERVLAEIPSGAAARAKICDVKVSVNGVDLDFADFADFVNRQLDTLVTGAARDLVKELLGSRIQDLTDRYDAALRELTFGVEREAIRLLKRAP